MPRNEPFLDPGCYRREGFRSIEHKTGRRIPVRTIIINGAPAQSPPRACGKIRLYTVAPTLSVFWVGELEARDSCFDSSS